MKYQATVKQNALLVAQISVEKSVSGANDLVL